MELGSRIHILEWLGESYLFRLFICEVTNEPIVTFLLVRTKAPQSPLSPANIKPDAYGFLFEPNPNWSKFFSPGAEINEYIQRTAKKWNLERNIQFNSRVKETVWDDESGKWKIQVDQDGTVKHDEADILVNATGFLK